MRQSDFFLFHVFSFKDFSSYEILQEMPAPPCNVLYRRGKYYSSISCREIPIIIKKVTCATVLPNAYSKKNVYTSYPYLETKSNIAVFLDTDIFVTHFSVTKVCQYSYPVSITISLDNFENCFPWQCFYIHLDSKQAHLWPSSGRVQG